MIVALFSDGRTARSGPLAILPHEQAEAGDDTGDAREESHDAGGPDNRRRRGGRNEAPDPEERNGGRDEGDTHIAHAISHVGVPRHLAIPETRVIAPNRKERGDGGERATTCEAE